MPPKTNVLSILGPSGDAFYTVLWLPSRFRQLFILLVCALSMGAYLMWVVSRTYCRCLLSQSLYKHQKFYFVPWTFIGRVDRIMEMLGSSSSPLVMSHFCNCYFRAHFTFKKRFYTHSYKTVPSRRAFISSVAVERDPAERMNGLGWVFFMHFYFIWNDLFYKVL